jgi:hypothetical protein
MASMITTRPLRRTVGSKKGEVTGTEENYIMRSFTTY